MKFLLESNPAFLLLKVEKNEYIFYNSLLHIGARLSNVETQILDLVYTYQDREYILSKFPQHHRDLIGNAISAIEEHQLLKCDKTLKEENISTEFPVVYYIHLTYRCNLNCLYCYNKTIRQQLQQDLNIEDWKIIIDKIIPYANRIVFTGGECFLYSGIEELMNYIKNKNSDITIAVISNGMHHFEKFAGTQLLRHISELTLSCDSLYSEGKRIGFNATLFRNNIEWLKKNIPNISLSLSSVHTSENSLELKKTESYCIDNLLSYSKTILIPETASQIELMPSIKEVYDDYSNLSNKDKIQKLDPPRFRCGAGRAVCSIAPNGDVYPCQSLHYPELMMGNLLSTDIENLKHNLVIKGVDDILVCSKCNVKYLCGGGCLASGYSFYKHRFDRNHLTCYLNRHNALEKLKLLDNRLNK